MKAEIINGVMVIYPDTPTEAYAVAHWRSLSRVAINDQHRMEIEYIRGSTIRMEYLQEQKAPN